MNVKPALPYLDICSALRRTFDVRPWRPTSLRRVRIIKRGPAGLDRRESAMMIGVAARDSRSAARDDHSVHTTAEEVAKLFAELLPQR